MPTFEGLEVSQEVLDAITGHTANLVKNKDDILSEKKQTQELLDTERLAVKANQDALEMAEKQRLEQTNDWDGMKVNHAKELAELKATSDEQTNLYKNMVLNQAKSESQGIILDKVMPEWKRAAKAMLDADSVYTHDENGVLAKEFKTGDGVVSTEEEYLGYIAEHDDTWRLMLTGPNSTGAGVKQSQSGAPTKDPKTLTGAERLAFKKRDPIGFSKAYNLN